MCATAGVHYVCSCLRRRSSVVADGRLVFPGRLRYTCLVHSMSFLLCAGCVSASLLRLRARGWRSFMSRRSLCYGQKGRNSLNELRPFFLVFWEIPNRFPNSQFLYTTRRERRYVFPVLTALRIPPNPLRTLDEAGRIHVRLKVGRVRSANSGAPRSYQAAAGAVASQPIVCEKCSNAERRRGICKPLVGGLPPPIPQAGLW